MLMIFRSFLLFVSYNFIIFSPRISQRLIPLPVSVSRFPGRPGFSPCRKSSEKAPPSDDLHGGAAGAVGGSFRKNPLPGRTPPGRTGPPGWLERRTSRGRDLSQSAMFLHVSVLPFSEPIAKVKVFSLRKGKKTLSNQSRKTALVEIDLSYPTKKKK